MLHQHSSYAAPALACCLDRMIFGGGHAVLTTIVPILKSATEGPAGLVGRHMSGVSAPSLLAEAPKDARTFSTTAFLAAR